MAAVNALRAGAGSREPEPWGWCVDDRRYPSLSNATVRQRARYAVLNDPWLANAAAAWPDGLIGAGAMPNTQVQDQVSRQAIMAAWGRWVPRADADGRTDGPVAKFFRPVCELRERAV